jgi:hypothetical protein
MPFFSLHRRSSVATVVGAVVALAAVLLAGVAPAHAAESVLVNANADGDTPLAGGTVRASACARPGVGAGAALRQTNGTLEEPTNAAGATLLEFKRLPRCLIVDVAGGQANGATLPGSFRAEARNHSGAVMSVLVTPVTTLTYAARRQHPGLSRGGAKRVVDRLLGIPAVFDDIDLNADDGPFDGDSYLATAERAGSVAKLNQSLLRTAQGHGRHTFRAQHARASDAVIDVDAWWKDLDVTKMVKDGLKDFGLSILTSALESGGKWVLGRLLDEWGLKDLKDFCCTSDTTKIIEMIQELTIRVNKLQETSDTILKEVLNGQFDQSVAPAGPLLSRIDSTQLDIQNLLKLANSDPGRIGATKKILLQIEGMEKDRNLLNFLLTRSGPAGQSILVTASKKAAAQDRWFTAKDSQDVVDVYKYFAIYQLRMANLLTELWNTQSCNNTPVPPDCLSTTTIQQYLDKFQTDIDAQAKLLKPPLPPGTFIDRNTMRMWPTASWLLNGQDALNWTSVWQPRRCVDTARKRTCKGSAEGDPPLVRRTNLSLPALGPWTDWQTPTEDDFKSLIDGWQGDSPLAWLHKNTGFRTTTMSPQNDKDRLSGHMWFRDSFRPGFYLYVYRINLSEPDRPGPHVWYRSAYMPKGTLKCSGNVCTEDPSTIDFSDIRTNYTAQMVLWRPVQPGDYWEP